MTRAYNDIDAVTRLLEEKERDLELAARIGQGLLEKNKQLSSENEELEEQLCSATEKVAQCKHEISMKDALLHVYSHDLEDESPSAENEGDFSQLAGHGLDLLQKKVKDLEEENRLLQNESTRLKGDTSDLEEKEHILLKDVLKDINDTHRHLSVVQEELAQKHELTHQQEEEIHVLVAKIKFLEEKIRHLTVENADIQVHLASSQDCQKQLTTELSEMRDKYHESLALLQEAQEEVKSLKGHQKVGRTRPHYGHHYNLFPPDGSLASELEDSIRRASGPEQEQTRSQQSRAMATVRCARKAGQGALSSALSCSMISDDSGVPNTADVSNRSSLYLPEEAAASLAEEMESTNSNQNNSTEGTAAPPVIDIPGSSDFEAALKRLSLRRANEINEAMFGEVSNESEMSGCVSPDSIMSTGSRFSELSRLSGFQGGFHGYKMPQRLQIVKPMEGSLTLHQWQQLATPNMADFLYHRPGIRQRGQSEAPEDTDLFEDDSEMFCLSDLEEDTEDDLLYPVKSLDSSMTYTYTNSHIMHPTHEFYKTSVNNTHEGSPNLLTSHSGSTSRCTSTFSISTGLAQQLLERHIAARFPNPDISHQPGLGPEEAEKSEKRDISSKLRCSPTSKLPPEGISQTAYMALCNKPINEGVLPDSPPLLRQKRARRLASRGAMQGLSHIAKQLVQPPDLDLVQSIREAGLEDTASITAAQANVAAGLNAFLDTRQKRPSSIASSIQTSTYTTTSTANSLQSIQTSTSTTTSTASSLQSIQTSTSTTTSTASSSGFVTGVYMSTSVLPSTSSAVMSNTLHTATGDRVEDPNSAQAIYESGMKGLSSIYGSIVAKIGGTCKTVTTVTSSIAASDWTTSQSSGQSSNVIYSHTGSKVSVPKLISARPGAGDSRENNVPVEIRAPGRDGRGEIVGEECIASVNTHAHGVVNATISSNDAHFTLQGRSSKPASRPNSLSLSSTISASCLSEDLLNHLSKMHSLRAKTGLMGALQPMRFQGGRVLPPTAGERVETGLSLSPQGRHQ